MSGEQTIFRVASRHKPFSQLGNAMLSDHRLSFESRGMLGFILSKPSDWEFTLEWLCREASIGRDRARRMVRELVEIGYCGRERPRNRDGTLGPYVYVFTDELAVAVPEPEKATVDAKPHAGDKTTDGKPVTGEPAPAKPTQTKNIDPNKITKIDPAKSGSDSKGAPRPAQTARYVTEDALDKVRTIAPGWDRQFLLKKFTDWDGSRRAADLNAAFLGWVKKFTKGKQP